MRARTKLQVQKKKKNSFFCFVSTSFWFLLRNPVLSLCLSLSHSLPLNLAPCKIGFSRAGPLRRATQRGFCVGKEERGADIKESLEMFFFVSVFFKFCFFFPLFNSPPLSPERRNTGQRAWTGGPDRRRRRRREKASRPPGKTQQRQQQHLQLQEQPERRPPPPSPPPRRPPEPPKPAPQSCRSGSATPGTTASPRPGQPQQPRQPPLPPLPPQKKTTEKSSAGAGEGTRARRRPRGRAAPRSPATRACAPLGCPAASRRRSSRRRRRPPPPPRPAGPGPPARSGSRSARGPRG